MIDLARLRQFDVKEVFKYNLISSSYLFEADGLIATTSKSLLVTELEKKLKETDFTYPISSSIIYSMLCHASEDCLLTRIQHSVCCVMPQKIVC